MKISQVGKLFILSLMKGVSHHHMGFARDSKVDRVGKLYSRKMGRLRVCLDFKVAGTRKL